MHPTPSQSAPTILLVVQCAIHREWLERVLSQAGFAVAVATHPQAVHDAVARNAPALVLIDELTPEPESPEAGAASMDGIDVLRALQRGARTRRLPVLMLAARNRPDTRVRALWQGARECLTTPVDPDELVDVVRNLTNVRIGASAANA